MRLIAAIVACVSTVAYVIAAPVENEVSPFSGVRWVDDRPEVRIEETWYQLLSIQGASTEDLIRHCRRVYADAWRKRFDEDLVRVLREMRRLTGNTAVVEARRLDSGEVVHFPAIPLTTENRAALMTLKYERDGGSPVTHANMSDEATPVQRVVRAHASSPDPRYAELTTRGIGAGRMLTGAEARDDLDQLEWLLKNRFAYLTLRGVDIEAAIDALRCGVEGGVTTGDLALQMQKLVALFGDGHSGVSGSQLRAAMPAGALPCNVVETSGRIFALSTDGRSFLDPEHPVLGGLDGDRIESWLDAARPTVPRGSDPLLRRGCVERLTWISYLRAELGRPGSDSVTLNLESLDGSSTRSLALPVAAEPPRYIPPHPKVSGLRDDGLGYLRIEMMRDDLEYLDALQKMMSRFRGARGLIIDVRGNGGGTRDVLRVLYPYFCKPDDPPSVLNVARYRLGPGEPPDAKEGYLSDRFLFPPTASVWSPRERAVIDAFLRSFKPEWIVPADGFSGWHVFVAPAGAIKPSDRFDRPVAILMDSNCFSATDVFLSAFKGRPGVTLIGTPSGGGSGRKRGYTLAHSGIEVRLSSMASFRADGRLYDGRGIEPDVLAPATPDDLIGRTDSVLDLAVSRLRP
ncbi:MAG: hypothetical protein KJ057_07595 [Phycisphaerae bacterium]|nr:MAG: hypothetical protein EDS66_04600 [Planctomycetota bacterium]KAB2949805.1 MAG: hypothetical protein F9K17_01745 [Phycisphaerae bacterium]MBE7456989.1 hypothetical protein [Planctomycetia bacterium]MCK6463652.1 S41 family peptidase [Phycisphaerae bacterium]MCL4718321.1 hypothetical protein [Phycisphaerae bacterium]